MDSARTACRGRNVRGRDSRRAVDVEAELIVAPRYTGSARIPRTRSSRDRRGTPRTCTHRRDRGRTPRPLARSGAFLNGDDRLAQGQRFFRANGGCRAESIRRPRVHARPVCQQKMSVINVVVSLRGNRELAGEGAVSLRRTDLLLPRRAVQRSEARLRLLHGAVFGAEVRRETNRHGLPGSAPADGATRRHAAAPAECS